MGKSETGNKQGAARRSFLKKGALGIGAAAIGAGFLARESVAFAQDREGASLTKGDAAILQLTLVDIADVHTVQTFEAPELGVTFTYWMPTQKHLGHKEARQKTVPQAVPASRGETNTSIEVHTTGR